MSKRRGLRYRSGRSPLWIKSEPTRARVVRRLSRRHGDSGMRRGQIDRLATPLASVPHGPFSKRVTKARGLSAAIIQRMLGSSKLPARARAIIVEYVEEKSFGLYGGKSRRQQQRFAVRLSKAIARSSGSEEIQEEMPRVPAPPTAADGAAFALSDIRWPGWMWCSTPA